MMLTTFNPTVTIDWPLTHSAVGISSPETTGQKAAIDAVFYCPAKIKAVLSRLLSMVDCSGQPSGWPVPVAGTANPVQSATQELAVLLGGYFPTTGDRNMHTLKTSAQGKNPQSRFHVVTRSGRSLARRIPFGQAIQLKANHPGSLIKFAGMEGKR